MSPDAGWPELAAFLGQTRKQLVVGMYDCGAPHIVQALEALGGQAGFKKLTLAMQKGASTGSGTKIADLDDQAVVDRLDRTLADKFEHVWVQIGAVNGWVASSYHIKLAVRDGRACWLSSGNWQSSNQPPRDPVNETPSDRQWLDRYNREWHAIIEHPGLARTLEAFLQNDFANNVGAGRAVLEEQLGLPDFLVAEALLAREAAEGASMWRYFPPLDETRRFTVRPLLTPDNYHRYVLQLVRSAREELLIQNQTFNAPREGDEALRRLVDAVIAKQRAGVRVRIIFRLLLPTVARQTLENLKDYGLDLADVKVQARCHTKGIVVDRRRVLLGSQNWSNDGVSVNRDASFLFEDAPLAHYFGGIFDHDWDYLADRKIGSEWSPVRMAGAGDATPPGMAWLAWKAYEEG